MARRGVLASNLHTLKYERPPHKFQGTLGLILGQFSGAGAWLVIDYCTGMTGNSIYWV